MITIGPVQLLVIGFAEPEFNGKVRAELDRLREHDTIRLIDLILVRKTADGEIERLHHSDLTAEEGGGARRNRGRTGRRGLRRRGGR